MRQFLFRKSTILEKPYSSEGADRSCWNSVEYEVSDMLVVVRSSSPWLLMHPELVDPPPIGSITGNAVSRSA